MEGDPRVTHVLFFERILHPGSGYRFFCDAQGEVHPGMLTPEGARNYAMCVNDEGREFREPVVDEWPVRAARARPLNLRAKRPPNRKRRAA